MEEEGKVGQEWEGIRGDSGSDSEGSLHIHRMDEKEAERK